MGIAGWGTDQELEALLREGVRYQPDVVAYQFCSNDVTDIVQPGVKPFGVEPKQKPFQYFLGEGGEVVRRELPWPPGPGPTWQERVKEVLLSSCLLDNLNRLRLQALSYWRTGAPGLTAADKERFVLGNKVMRPDPVSPYFIYPASTAQETKELRAAWALLEALMLKMKGVAEAHGAEFLVFSASECEAGRRWRLKWDYMQTDGQRDFISSGGKQYPMDFRWPTKKMDAICRRHGVPFIKPVREYEPFEYDPHANEKGNLAMAEDVVDFLQGWDGFRRKVASQR
jgi:hypothetical protein